MTSRRSEAAGRPCLSRHQERQQKAAIPTNVKSGLMMLLLQKSAGQGHHHAPASGSWCTKENANGERQPLPRRRARRRRASS